jgi:eukaryotic-like serine/threonine-protein kinase
MDVMAGRRLGPYEIISRIGSGGMGEVLRARDTRLNRTVAIKILSRDFAANEQRKARFDREAKAISRLNHPHICMLHDVGSESGTNYLVMEFIEGEPLSHRLENGPLPIHQVLQYGIEIAEALTWAHRAGIVHRDLKPSNIMITKVGVKLLDFGLAKVDPKASATESTTASISEEGKFVGTIRYMAPEVLTGAAADARSDIFALGLVLYEMLTGRAAFSGTSRPGVIAAVLERDPPPVRDIRPDASEALEYVIARCLHKDPDQRWQSAKDVVSVLHWLSHGSAPPRREPSRWWKRTAIVATAAFGIAAAAAVYVHRPAVRQMSTLAMAPPQGWIFDEPFTGPFAVSPDGGQIVFVGVTEDGKRKLWLRRLNDGITAPIDGTEDGSAPFWSPDGQTVAFFTPYALKSVRLSGGTSTTLFTQSLVGVLGGAWSRGGKIVVSMGGIYTVPLAGGKPRPVVRFADGLSYNNPTFLDEEHIAITRVAADAEPELIVVSLKDGNPRTIRKNAAAPTYTRRGTLLFISGETLLAQKFDERKLEFTDEPITIAKPVAWDGPNAAGSYSVARDGDVLLYQPTASFDSELMIVDSTGHRLKTIHPSAQTNDPYVSHDGSRAAFIQFNSNGSSDIWIADLQRQVFTRLTRSGSHNSAPVFSPDDRRIAFSDGHNIVEIATDGGQRKVLLQTQGYVYPSDWSADGESILFTNMRPTPINIDALRLSDRRAIPVVSSRYMDVGGRLSPDGKWIAYASYESGTFEVYVQRFPEGGSKTQISSSGGSQPQWSSDGRRIYYVANGKLTSSDVSLGPTIRVTASRPWFDFQAMGSFNPTHTPLADGTFLINALTDTSQRHLATVVLNWRERLRDRQ